jgi:hypothetical protein
VIISKDPINDDMKIIGEVTGETGYAGLRLQIKGGPISL